MNILFFNCVIRITLNQIWGALAVTLYKFFHLLLLLQSCQQQVFLFFVSWWSLINKGNNISWFSVSKQYLFHYRSIHTHQACFFDVFDFNFWGQFLAVLLSEPSSSSPLTTVINHLCFKFIIFVVLANLSSSCQVIWTETFKVLAISSPFSELRV